jgi:hypothetical protein
VPRGGKRAGAGRPRGSLCKKTLQRQQLLEQAAAGALMPLPLMLDVMRQHFEAGRLAEAVAVAIAAAPFCHPKLSAIEMQVSNAELDAQIEVQLQKRAGAARPAADGPTNGQADGPHATAPGVAQDASGRPE